MLSVRNTDRMCRQQVGLRPLGERHITSSSNDNAALGTLRPWCWQSSKKPRLTDKTASLASQNLQPLVSVTFQFDDHLGEAVEQLKNKDRSRLKNTR
jgi:hypothetical protein